MPQKYVLAGSKNLHVVLAEKALGCPLPKGAVVHHADGDPHNNNTDNLVICPDQAYHQLLHMRMNAMNECGHPDWRKCYFCKEYDDLVNLKITPKRKQGMTYHAKCFAAYKRVYRANGGKS